MVETYIKKDDWGDELYCVPVYLQLIACSYNNENLDDIEESVFDVLNDKSFDGICWFEKLKDINSKRFEYNRFDGRIYDNLTGKGYGTLTSIEKLLNKLDERANRNAELVDGYKYG